MSEIAKRLCPACQSGLILASASFPMGSTFARERFHVDIYRCLKCARVAPPELPVR
jgi:hypothetical protein